MKTHRESHVKAEHNYNTQMHTLFKGNRMPLKLSLCLFLLLLIHLFFSFLYGWHYLHCFYPSLLIPVSSSFFSLLLFCSNLIYPGPLAWGGNGCLFGQVNKEQWQSSSHLPDSHTHSFPTLSLSLICVCLSLSSRCDWYQCQEASVLQLEQMASVYGFYPG